jgi:hypothetical protein
LYTPIQEQFEDFIPLNIMHLALRRHESSDHSDSDSDGSEVDVSCSRLVRYEERDQMPGLTVFRRGPATWIPIKAAKIEPIAARTRSKTLNT